MSESTLAPSGIAVKIGAHYIEAKVFNWLDGLFRLNKEIKIDTHKSEDPISDFESKLKELAEEDRARGVDLAKNPMPVFISNACEVNDATGEAKLPFFKDPKANKDLPKTYNPVNSLKKDYNVYIHNDGREQLGCAVLSFKDQAGLEPGDTVYHFISGQGFGGVSGQLDSELNVVNFENNEPGHKLMPGLKKNIQIEGYERTIKKDFVTGITGAAEPYVAGGNDDDPNSGPKATFYSINNIISKYNEKAETNTLFLDLLQSTKPIISNLNYEDYEASLVKKTFDEQGKITTKDIGEAAQKGDKLAKAILVFTASRVADVMINTIKSEDRFTNDKKPKLISYSGGLAKCFQNECPEAWLKLESKLQKELKSEKLKLRFIEPKENMDGTVEALEEHFKVLNSRAA